jgi:hypothetical protein
MRGLSSGDLLRPVRLRGIQLGRAVDVIVDAELRRVLGLDVLCGDGEHRFLPFAAAEARPDEIAVSSSLTLLDRDELAFYRRHGASLAELRGESVRGLGALEDVVVGEGGELQALVVREDGCARRVPAGQAEPV